MNSKKLTTALLVASAAFPASASALPHYDDLRSPDARDAAIQASAPPTRTCATRTRAATPSPPSGASSP